MNGKLLMLGLMVTVLGVRAEQDVKDVCDKQGHPCVVLPTLPEETAGRIAECVFFAKVLQASALRLYEDAKNMQEKMPQAVQPCGDAFDRLACQIERNFYQNGFRQMQAEHDHLRQDMDLLRLTLDYYGLCEGVLELVDPQSENLCQECRMCLLSCYIRVKELQKDLGLVVMHQTEQAESPQPSEE